MWFDDKPNEAEKNRSTKKNNMGRVGLKSDSSGNGRRINSDSSGSSRHSAVYKIDPQAFNWELKQLEEIDITTLQAGTRYEEEDDLGSTEYKWKLVGLTKSRFEHLVTQMNFRLQEGQGEAKYLLGVEDDGYPRGLSDHELAQTLVVFGDMVRAVQQIAANSNHTCTYSTLRTLRGEEGKLVEVFVRRHVRTTELKTREWFRVAVLGGGESGKSTIIGVLTGGKLDNGRGSARISVLRHLHEIELGRTSAVSHHLMGFDDGSGQSGPEGGTDTEETVKMATTNDEDEWHAIVRRSTKVVTFIDLAGHASYLSTTVYGMTSNLPDYCMVNLDARSSIPSMTLEHMGLAAALGIPVYVVLTKADLYSNGGDVSTCECVQMNKYGGLYQLTQLLAPRKHLLLCDSEGKVREAIASFERKCRPKALDTRMINGGFILEKQKYVSLVHILFSTSICVCVAELEHKESKDESLQDGSDLHLINKKHSTNLAVASLFAVSLPPSPLPSSLSPSMCHLQALSMAPSLSLVDENPVNGDDISAESEEEEDRDQAQRIEEKDRAETAEAEGHVRLPTAPAPSATEPDGAHLVSPLSSSIVYSLAKSAYSLTRTPSEVEQDETHAASVVPVFITSSVSGHGLSLLRLFLSILPKRKVWERYQDLPALFDISAHHNVPNIGTVVSGILRQGRVSVGDSVLLGPFLDGTFRKVGVASIHFKRCPVDYVVAGQSASFFLRVQGKSVKRSSLRKGLVLVSLSTNPVACRSFEVGVTVLRHPSALQVNQEYLIHCGCVRQAARVVSVRRVLGTDHKSSAPDTSLNCADDICQGQAGFATFVFLHHCEFLSVGSKVVIMEGTMRGVGRVTSVGEECVRKKPEQMAATVAIEKK